MEFFKKTGTEKLPNCSKSYVDVICDLLAIIEKIVKGAALISTNAVNNLLECEIQIDSDHPSVIVLYEHENESIDDDDNFTDLPVTESKINFIKNLIPSANSRTFIELDEFVNDAIAAKEYKLRSHNLYELDNSGEDSQDGIVVNSPQPNAANTFGVERLQVDLTSPTENECTVSINSAFDDQQSDASSSSTHKNFESVVLSENFEDDLNPLDNPRLIIKLNEMTDTEIARDSTASLGNATSTSSTSSASMDRRKISDKPFRINIKTEPPSPTPDINLDFDDDYSINETGFASCYQNSASGSIKKAKLAEMPRLIGKFYCCKFCGKAFPHKIPLQIHERIHTGEKPFRCSYCAKSFARKGDKKTHERVHTGERPYTCDYCTKSFSQAGTLKIHKRIHTGEKPYRCHYCPKTFSHRSTIVKHEKYHIVNSLKENRFAEGDQNSNFKDPSNSSVLTRVN